MTYESAGALRGALERRLLNVASETGISLDRLRRRVVFERIVARLAGAQAGAWVVKGGMALEARLRDRARLTKDIDLGLREQVEEEDEIRGRLIEGLSRDLDGDLFSFAVGEPRRLAEDDRSAPTWRLTVRARLAASSSK